MKLVGFDQFVATIGDEWSFYDISLTIDSLFFSSIMSRHIWVLNFARGLKRLVPIAAMQPPSHFIFIVENIHQRLSLISIK